MGSKYLIPISFFIICQAAYDSIAPSQSTNWSIFYFVSQYLSWLMLILLLPKKYKLPYYTMGTGISIYIIIQLSKINTEYIEWLTSVNNYELCVLPIVVIVSGLTYFIVKR